MPWATVLFNNPPLAAFHNWRISELSAVLERLSAACEKELLWDRRLDGPGADQFELSVTGATVVTTQLDQGDQLDSVWCAAARRNELRIPATSSIGPFGAEPVNILSRAVEIGFSGVEFDGYGTMPDSAFSSIKQAIRFARRSAD